MAEQSISALIWSTADLLRGDYKQSDYGKIILPFTLLRRLECVLEPTRDDVLTENEARKNLGIPMEQFLTRKSGHSFYNTSKYTLTKLMSDPSNISQNLESYINDFSPNAREIFEKYEFTAQIDKLNEANLLYLIIEKFATVDLHPDTISNHAMGIVFEELIRKFAEQSNETAGEHFTPRDIVRLTTSLLFSTDDDVLTKKGIVRSLYDPTAGTGGFLSSGSEYVHELNPDATLVTFGQELNGESYAICKADMMIKGVQVENIKHGNTLSDDQLGENKFDYMLSNPPFGVEWKKVEKVVKAENAEQGYNGRFGPGLPRVSDGSLLFLLHLVSKMRPKREGGSRIGIILNGSPLFTGGAGSGESEIRRYILENDYLEAIVAMPNDMFFNTGIATYIWILSNNKPEHRQGEVQLINASSMGNAMRKSLGSKRKFLDETQISDIVRIYGENAAAKISKIFNITDFGYRRITVERSLQLSYFPHDADKLESLQNDKVFVKMKELGAEILTALGAIESDKIMSRTEFKNELSKKMTSKLSATQFKLVQKHISMHDDEAELCKDSKGKLEANADLRDYENIPLSEDINEYFAREVTPHVPLAWIDEKKRDAKDGEVGIVGYEIPFNRHFYEYAPPRPLEEIDAELETLNAEIMEMLREI
ncbi:type I restriction-modification system subunit M [Sulfurimonas autotrophica]|uniref:site-specific DNA-methyltransferase (adenine-specific) n=1 Tax=Sulfurimonas autotrophica (strain ATCC BAA-671 / DSM 16294 / JCM 11897 / OK10) TaxID=563040 RepID=E0UTB3_SULAO|nr:class I SAM-dependent DNA methyltransferase [Sulfurimonas autotrophica]ADN08216.1 N-6 DNA methylase [Sulfurimonas autotrophica DSM 16294]